MLRIALVSDSANPIAAGEALLLDRMQAAPDLQVQELNWQTTVPDGLNFDLVIPRTAWSYYEDRDAFFGLD